VELGAAPNLKTAILLARFYEKTVEEVWDVKS
jgi:DNA-binding XRE family transcriptional regulator